MQGQLQDLREQITYLIGQIRDPQKSHQNLQQLGVITNESVKIQTVKINKYFNKQSSQIECNRQQSLQNLTVNKINHRTQYTKIFIEIVPTVPHCHLTQQIGLLIRYLFLYQGNSNNDTGTNLKRNCLILINTKSKSFPQSMQKQVNDKQRVQAAFQNQQITTFLQSHTRIN